VRDAILGYLRQRGAAATVAEICAGAKVALGRPVADSSVRSYLNLNAPHLFLRTGRGRYQLANGPNVDCDHRAEALESQTGAPALTLYEPAAPNPVFHFGRATLFHNDCLDWLRRREQRSVHAVITDPPYGLVEYSSAEQSKLRKGRGGVWRIPPSFDGCKRS